MGLNDQLFNKIQQNLQDISSHEMAQAHAAEKLDGAARVARGESVTEIRENAPFLEKVFGRGATLAGARTMAVEQGVNNYITEAANNLSAVRDVDPELFAAQQVDVLSGYMTGDKETDARILAAGQKGIREVSKLQHKAHQAYIQEEATNQFFRGIDSASNRVNAVSALGDPVATNEALTAYTSALDKPDVMDKYAHKKRLLQYASLRASQGDLNFEDVMQASTVPLTSEDRLELLKAKDAAWAKHKQDKNIALDVFAAGIDERVSNNTISVDEIIQAGQEYEAIAGPGSSGDKVRTWLGGKAKASGEKMTDQDILERYMRDMTLEFGVGLTPAQAQRGSELLELQMKDDVANGRRLQEDADKIIIDRWKFNGIVPARKKSRWNAALQNPIDAEGTPTQAMMDLVHMFPKYREASPTKAAQMITDKTDLQMLLNVIDDVNSNVPPAQALARWKDRTKVEATQQFLNSRSGDELIAKVKATALEGSPWWKFLGEKYPDAKNSPVLNSLIEQSVRTLYAQSGTDANLEAAVMSDVLKKTTFYRGDWLPTGGINVTEEMGVTGEFETVIDDFVRINKDALFEGYDTDQIRVEVSPMDKSLMFTYLDENNQRVVPPSGMFYVPMSLAKVGATYNADVLVEHDKQIAAENRASVEEEVNHIFNRMKETHMFPEGTPDEVIMDAATKSAQSVINPTARRVAGETLTFWGNHWDEYTKKFNEGTEGLGMLMNDMLLGKDVTTVTQPN